jgi:hypothetical protein
MRASDQNNPDVIQFNRSTRGTDRNDDQVDQVGEAMLQLLGRAADSIESIISKRMTGRSGWRMSFAVHTTGSCSLRARWQRCKNEPIMRSSGCTGFTRKSRGSSSTRTPAALATR